MTSSSKRSAVLTSSAILLPLCVGTHTVFKHRIFLQVVRFVERRTDGRTDGQTDRQTGQTDRQTGQTDRQTGQTDRTDTVFYFSKSPINTITSLKVKKMSAVISDGQTDGEPDREPHSIP